jgi:hypothetical protein
MAVVARCVSYRLRRAAPWEQTKPFDEPQQPQIPKTVLTRCQGLLLLHLQQSHAIVNHENAEASCTHMHNDDVVSNELHFFFTCPLTPPITAAVILDRERSPLFRAIDNMAAVATAICFPPCAPSNASRRTINCGAKQRHVKISFSKY